MGIVTIPTAGFISDEDEDVNEGLVEVGLVECAVTQMDYKKKYEEDFWMQNEKQMPTGLR